MIAKQLWKRRYTATTVSQTQRKSWRRYLSCICFKEFENVKRNLKEHPVDLNGQACSSASILSGVGTITDTHIKIPQPSSPSVTSIEQFILPSNVTRSAPTNSNNNYRATRHIRMFTIIIVLIAGFLFLRLPTWVFLLMRICGSYKGRNTIILHYCFGILNITSSVLNPFFYTFLTETIKCAHIIKRTFFCGVCRFRLRHPTKQEVMTYPTVISGGLEKGNTLSEASSLKCC